jgi:hypothetical protein
MFVAVSKSLNLSQLVDNTSGGISVLWLFGELLKSAMLIKILIFYFSQDFVWLGIEWQKS